MYSGGEMAILDFSPIGMTPTLDDVTAAPLSGNVH
jgi:hypothetical protein